MNISNFNTYLETLRVIERFIEQHGQSPTVDEIAQRRNIHRSAINKQLVVLAERGYIERRGGWRNIRVIRRAT
jgi:DNA-binding MarR family transcriptional regulator